MIQSAPRALHRVLLIITAAVLLVTGGWVTAPHGVVAADAGTSRATPAPPGT